MSGARAKVSVVIPAYNASKHVLEALESVRAQNYAPLEILLVDDGSNDDTAELVERAMPEATIIRQANSGAAMARNNGLARASGDFICFLDADDGWFPGKLDAQLAYMERHPETGAVTHSWINWRPRSDGNYAPLAWTPPTEPLAVDPAQSGWIYPRLLMEYLIQTSTVMIRREVARTVGFFSPDLVTGEDYDYWLRLSRLTRIDKLSGIYSFYRRDSGENLTGTMQPCDYGYEVVRAAFARWGLTSPDGTVLARSRYERRLGQLAFDFAYGHYHCGSPALARQAAWRAFRHGYRRCKSLAYCVASTVEGAVGKRSGR